MRGHDVVLAVEVADTSLAYDRGRKVAVYAAYGIAEVWVIDASSLITRVHRYLGAEGYGAVFEVGPTEEIAAKRAPKVSMCLAALVSSPSEARRFGSSAAILPGPHAAAMLRSRA